MQDYNQNYPDLNINLSNDMFARGDWKKKDVKEFCECILLLCGVNTQSNLSPSAPDNSPNIIIGHPWYYPVVINNNNNSKSDDKESKPRSILQHLGASVVVVGASVATAYFVDKELDDSQVFMKADSLYNKLKENLADAKKESSPLVCTVVGLMRRWKRGREYVYRSTINEKLAGGIGVAGLGVSLFFSLPIVLWSSTIIAGGAAWSYYRKTKRTFMTDYHKGELCRFSYDCKKYFNE